MLKGLREHASAGFTTNTNMDTVVLDELLECSVCLEQLDQTSKVLPCQHTFCKRCLKELVESRKELRCPECRVLVDANVDDLPTNIFLVRILEGLKQQKQRKGSSDLDKDSTDQASPCARALYDYEPKEAGDLALHKGEIIGLLRQVDENWYEGYVGGLQGFLPANYVEIINPLPSLDDAFDRPIAKALYDFEDEQEQDLLTFKQGDVITVKRRVDENWCEGKLNNKLGIFPLTFVELNSVARNLVEAENGSDEARPSGSGISKPPRKFSSESKDGEPKRHTMHFVGQRSGEAHATGLQRHSLDISSTERLAEALDNVSARSASSSSRQETTPPSSRSSGSPSSDQWQVSPPRSLSGHSQGSAVESSTGGSRPASAEIGKEMYIALYSYKPLKEDELELSRGDSYYVTDKCKDGWFKGFSVTSQKRGVFPGNYVRLASLHNLLTRARSSSTDQEAPSTASSQNNNQPHQQRPPPRHAATEGGSRPRFHRSESTPSCNPRAAVLMESLVVNLDQGVITGVENRATGEGLAGRNRFVATSPLPPPPAPKSSSFWKKLKGKKKDKTRLQPPPPPPPPYQRCIPAGHAMLSPPPYDFGTLPSLPQQVVRQDSPASQLRTHQRVENPPVRERYRVIVAYPPQHEAELELRVGDVVYVTKKRQDGWYKGTLERNGKTGLFPGSFVGSF